MQDWKIKHKKQDVQMQDRKMQHKKYAGLENAREVSVKSEQTQTA